MLKDSRTQVPPLPETKQASNETPVIGVTHEDGDDAEQLPRTLPILPLRANVVFPGTVVPLIVGRASSRKMLEESLPKSKVIALFAQRKSEQDDLGPDDLFPVGVAGTVLKLLRQNDEEVTVIVQAQQRIALDQIIQSEPFLIAEVRELALAPAPDNDPAWQAIIKNLRETSLQVLELTPDVPEQAREVVMNIQEPQRLTDFLASNLNIDASEKQALLEELDVAKRARAVQLKLSAQLEILRLQQKIQQDVASQFSEAQRRAFLREQIKAIQRELGESPGGSDEQIEELRERLRKAQPPPHIVAAAEAELRRLEYIPPAAAEYSIIVGYLEILVELPWTKVTEDVMDLDHAQEVLDRDHYDLDKVKRRLIEYLAVRKLNPTGRGPILCFLGPPGVGKTSLGQSIADALGRKFARMSLGGIRDEAEIRGHRRTYIGAMPGRIIQEIRRLGTRNPVLMLDEIDKLGSDFRGDPASALLEVLDPRQNHEFNDRYVDAPFDLSQVLFIATANYVEGIPPALRDRMEMIDVPGYADADKLQIAKRYLVKRQLQENGLKAEQLEFVDEALLQVIHNYTHEAGVRELERQIGAICRAIAARVAKGETPSLQITPEIVGELLGPAKYIRETRLYTNKPGVVTGLAFTPFGGEILHIEALRYPGKGTLTLTGQIGSVMKESAQAALSLVRSRSKELGISTNAWREFDLHIHVPSGAVPKDGPSAGIAMFTAIASLFSQTPVRAEIAVTGEISLRGLVLPVGGIKEKCLGAARAGIWEVLLPRLNQKDLIDVPREVRERMDFILVETVDDVLHQALAAQQRRPQRKEADRPRRRSTAFSGRS